MMANELGIAAQILERKARSIERIFAFVSGERPPIALRHALGLRTFPRRAQGTMSQSLVITKMVGAQEELQRKQGTSAVSSVRRL